MFRHGHSVIKSVDHSKYFEVKIIPALLDNYMYLIIDRYKKEAAVIDPVEPDRIKEVLDEEVALKLTSVLITHHHWDHAGGNKRLLKLYPDLQIFAADERTEGVTKIIKDRQILKIGNLTVCCMSTPCHTSGDMCFFVTGNHGESPALFSGDTLFVSGCGKIFEGTGQQMYDNMAIMAALPHPTRVYCGHEYTVTNLKFALNEDPSNFDLAEKLQWAHKNRLNSHPTVPSTIEEERRLNPFMRATNATATIALRARRDRFKVKTSRSSGSISSTEVSDRSSGTNSASSGISSNGSH
ncbi:Hydroxyacylglutathione hydrolase, mitochondrial [Hypsibius exemplaris]|uniref:hydroxyacylglutathione hydrolase n=1 Tax=Hypsibius exemplaris TaxID=2072580 RepID=A0A1W0WRX4_HYPEX|nr:Hydroxyacylglutathione hydrolase, mitochondrial [Hypsibius exemplaris]